MDVIMEIVTQRPRRAPRVITSLLWIHPSNSQILSCGDSTNSKQETIGILPRQGLFGFA